jgi:nanoRNase/pAp phosphatase (c-di-AMP/oligoRNAs hydrolase)
MKHQVVIDTIVKLWNESSSILLTGASNLDGDALGCLLALETFGRSQGKQMTIVNEKPLSSLYDFLGAKSRVLTHIPLQKYDSIYICDTGCFEMLGSIYTENTELFKNVPTINIDHHASCYGDICWSTG